MLATLAAEPFDSPEWLFEVKWDGVRTLAFCDESSTRLYSRSGREVTFQYPEFSDLHRTLKSSNAVLDGEIVALDPARRPSFELLQHRINLSRPADIARAVERIALDLVLFDVVFVDGRWVNEEPLSSRVERLGSLVEFGDRVQRSPPIPEHGVALFEAARDNHLEGIVAKRAASRYLPGRRSRDWLKIKTILEADCVIGGYSSGQGNRSGALGALLVGAFDDGLRYIGSVGTGFTEATLEILRSQLDARTTDECPFVDPLPPKGITWVRPELVCLVQYRELTKARKLRAPAFKGLRYDKSPQECRIEDLQA
jgi:bifunctional non-homologous end joining protein LigD